MDNTTIQIRTEQKRALDDLKEVSDESYKSVLQRLIDEYNNTSQNDLTEARVREIVNEQIAERVVAEAQR